ATCAALHVAHPELLDGTYTLDGGVVVDCDMTTDGGGWALVTRFVEGDACTGTFVAAPRGCGRGGANVVGATFAAPYDFGEIRGFVHALGMGGTDGFREVGAG